MKKSKTKSALFLSIVSILVCFAMLAGTTAAWFTDSVSNTGNRIQAGKLKVDLLMDKGGDDYVSIAGGKGDIFKESTKADNSNVTLWEPGKTQFVKLAVENEGNLALKYDILIDVTDHGLVGSLEYALINTGHEKPTDAALEYLSDWNAVKSDEGVITDSVADGRTKLGPDHNGVLDEIINGTQNERDYFILAVHMKEDAGNAYQGKDAIIDVTVVATQVEAEKDGFGNYEYDEDADYDKVPVPVHETVKVTITPGESVENGKLKGNTELIVEGTTTETSPIKATIPTNSVEVDAFGIKKIYNASGEVEDKSQQLVSGTQVGTSTSSELKLSVDNTENTPLVVSYEISMTADVITKTIAETTTEVKESYNVKELSHYTTVELPVGKNLKILDVKHSGVSMINDPTLNEEHDDNLVGLYKYDSANGILTIKTKTFSEFEVTFTLPSPEDFDLKIEKAGEDTVYMNLAQFRDSVNSKNSSNSYKDYTVTLQRDVDLNNVEWIPVGLKDNNKPFEGIFDGNNKTISNLMITKDYEAQKDGYSAKEDYAGLFGLVTGTVKNLTVKGSVSASNAAGVVARLDGGTVSNVTSEVTVTGTKKAGGISVLAQLDATFDGCVNKGAVTLNTSGPNRCVGGIVAMINSPVTVKNSGNNANIVVIGSSDQLIGGLVGHYQNDTGNKTLTISNSTNNGKVDASQSTGGDVGGIVGKVGSGAHVWTGYILFEDVVNTGELITNGGLHGEIIGGIADPAASGSYSGPNKPARIFAKGTLKVVHGKNLISSDTKDKEPICGNYGTRYNGSDELVASPVAVPYVNETPETIDGFDIYTGLYNK